MASSDATETPSSDAGDAQGLRYNGSPALFARMPAEVDAVYYSMNHKRRGLAVIFNHESFDMKNLKPRAGTQVDRNNLNESLLKLGFEVKVYDDLTFKSISEIVEEAARYDHNDCDCFVMAVLSHGEMGIIYAKDTAYKPEFLWTHFTADRCPSLAGKPKLFFIQACQGDKLDGGITLRTETDGAPLSYRIPTQADFLIAYSTVPGYYSWRNTTHGSWFMQALCWELQRRGTKLDILTLLTFVSQRVAIDFESNTPNNDVMHRQKQIPCITTMLTRLLRFEEKNYLLVSSQPLAQCLEWLRAAIAHVNDYIQGGHGTGISLRYPLYTWYSSWLDPAYGSRFVNALCSELQSRGTKLDILTLLTFVCQRVALDFETTPPNNDIMYRPKEVPSVTTLLTRLLCFEEKK